MKIAFREEYINGIEIYAFLHYINFLKKGSLPWGFGKLNPQVQYLGP